MQEIMWFPALYSAIYNVEYAGLHILETSLSCPLKFSIYLCLRYLKIENKSGNVWPHTLQFSIPFMSHISSSTRSSANRSCIMIRPAITETQGTCKYKWNTRRQAVYKIYKIRPSLRGHSIYVCRSAEGMCKISLWIQQMSCKAFWLRLVCVMIVLFWQAFCFVQMKKTGMKPMQIQE